MKREEIGSNKSAELEYNELETSEKQIEKSYDNTLLEESPLLLEQESWQKAGGKAKHEDFISSINRQRFKLTPKLAENVTKLRHLVQKYPLELLNIYVYVYRPQFNLWRRAFIREYKDNSNERTSDQSVLSV